MGRSGVVALTMPMTTRANSKLVLGGLLALLAAGYFINLGSAPLTEQSEARYAEVAWEMFTTHDYLTPRYNFIKHFHKPPLYYWSIATCFGFFGVHELSARLPSTLAALLCLALTWWFVRREMEADNQQACLAAGLLASTPFFWEMARVSITDMFVTLLVLLSFTSFLRLLRRPRSTPALFLFWLSLGLNFLTKGPVGPAIVLVAVLAYCRLRGVAVRTLRILPGTLLALTVGLPWYIWAVRSNPGLLSYFLKFQTLDRVVSTVHARGGPWWYYLPVIVGGFLPWTPWLLIRLRALVREPNWSSVDVLLGLWIIPPLLFFSVIGSKLPPYVLPLFPALAIFTSGGIRGLPKNQLRWPGAIFLLSGLLLFVQIALNAVPKLVRYTPELLWAGILLTISGIVLTVRPINWRVASSLAIATMFGLEISAAMAFPRIAYRTAQPIAEVVLNKAEPNFEIAMYGRYLFGLPYYLQRPVVHIRHEREVMFESNDDYKKLMRPTLESYLAEFRSGDRDRFLVVSQPDWPELKRYFQEPVVYSNERYLVLRHKRTKPS